MIIFSFVVFLLVDVLFAHVLPYYMANKDEDTLCLRKMCNEVFNKWQEILHLFCRQFVCVSNSERIFEIG